MSAALIIIDLIEDLIGPKGRANHCREQVTASHLLANVNAAAAYARVRKIPVIWVRTGFADDYHDIPLHSPLFNHLKQIGALRLNGPGCRWAPICIRRRPICSLIKRRSAPSPVTIC